MLIKRQRAYLLHLLADAGGGELALAKATKVPGWAKEQLHLSPEAATALLDALVAEQLVVGTQKGKSKKVGITQAGREALEQLAEFVTQPPPKKEKIPRPPKKSLAEQTAEKVRAKVAGLGDKPVTLAPPGRKNAKPEVVEAFEQTVRELIAAGKLFEHPGGKYGKRATPTLAETVRAEVQEKLATAAGPFKPAELSKPKRGASAEEKAAHAAELAAVIAELVGEKKLFPHPGGKYGQLPPPPPPPPPAFPDRELREVYTLDVFARAPDRTISKADIELAFPGKGKPNKKQLEAKHPHVARFRGQGCFEMGAPATRQTLDQLSAAGDLRADEQAGAYALTDAGAERLKRSRATYPVLPPLGNPESPDDAAMREKWEAFVLLRLTEGEQFTLGESAAFAGGYPKGSKLNEATAWVLYAEFVKSGRLTARWNGTEGEYALTPAGLRYLAGLSFDGFDTLDIKGTALTALLAARGGAAPSTSPVAPTQAGTPPADLEAAVMDVFHRLLRERHANVRMVPIHEVRAAVRERFGDRAASREVFNELLLDLRRAKKVRLVSIDDRSRATEQQLQDSVFAVGETFFYMETAHAPLPGG